MDEQHYEYRTGRTHPEKSSNGLIAALLILIIFLCGVISAMGLLNIRLTKLLANAQQDTPPLSFSQGQATTPTNVEHSAWMGMILQELPSVYQQIYDLPQGLFISQIEEDSPAGKLDIRPGDVLVSFGGASLTTLSQLEAMIGLYKPGDRVELAISRDGQQLQVNMTVS